MSLRPETLTHTSYHEARRKQFPGGFCNKELHQILSVVNSLKDFDTAECTAILDFTYARSQLFGLKSNPLCIK